MLTKTAKFCLQIQFLKRFFIHKMDNNEKKKLIKKHLPASPVFKNCTLSFIFGGIICVLGELLLTLFLYIGLDQKFSLTLTTVSVITLAAILTALGVFDKLAKHAGAGTLVPVSGFSNAVVSVAIDAKSEGMILGVGSKLFLVAGPVIVYGLLSGVLYGVILYSMKLLGVV